MNKRSAMIVAGALVVALMSGVAGATHQALNLKSAAGKPGTVVVVQQPSAQVAHVAAPPAEPEWSD